MIKKIIDKFYLKLSCRNKFCILNKAVTLKILVNITLLNS